jgi:hypothetical protein
LVFGFGLALGALGARLFSLTAAAWRGRGKEKTIIRGTSLKKRCQEGILLVAFDEIDAKYQWVSLGVWEVHFQA